MAIRQELQTQRKEQSSKDMRGQSGIYRIVNTKNGKMYIGSAVNLKRRKASHFSSLRSDRHFNGYLQESYNENNDGSKFRFEVVEKCDENNLIEKEQNYFDAFLSANLWDQLYNISTEAKQISLQEGHSQGSKNGMSKLNEDDIIEIRERCSNGKEMCTEIAEDYPVNPKHVYAIVSGELWGHVGGPIEGEDYKLHISEKDAVKIRFIKCLEYPTNRQLAEDFDTNVTTIYQVLNGDIYEDAGGPIIEEWIGRLPKQKAEEFFERYQDGERIEELVKECTYIPSALRRIFRKMKEEKGIPVDTQLSPEEVVDIRERYLKEDISQEELGKEYSIDQGNVGYIIRGNTWSDAGGPIKGEDYEKRVCEKGLTEKEVVEIRGRYYLEDIYQYKLAEIYDTEQANISNIITGINWPDANGPIKGEDY